MHSALKFDPLCSEHNNIICSCIELSAKWHKSTVILECCLADCPIRYIVTVLLEYLN